MIKFVQQQAILRFDAEPVIISSFTDDSVYVTVRLICLDPASLVSVSVMHPGAPSLPITQLANAPSAMRVNFALPYASVTAMPVQASTLAPLRTGALTPNVSGSMISTVLHGGDDVLLAANKCAAVIGDQLITMARMSARQSHTHEANVVIPVQNIGQPVRLSSTATVNGRAIAMVAVEVSLLERFVQLRDRIDDPEIKLRINAGATVVSTDASADRPVDIYLREVGQTTEDDAFVPLALGMRESELWFSKTAVNAAILVALRSDGQTGKSAGRRLIVASRQPDAPDARLVLLRSKTGMDLNVTRIVNADAVTVTRTSLGTTVTYGPELVGDRSTITFADVPGAGTHTYVVKLCGGTNARSLSPVTVSLRGDPFTPRPSVSNVLTTTSQAGFVAKFDIASPLQLGDASSARTLITGVGDAGLYVNELQSQRANYDPLPIFGVLRIDRSTGDTFDLGVVPSGTFSDTIPADLGIEHVRYIVSMALRDPLSLLPGTLTVNTGSGAPYSYEAAVFRHPYALDGGTLVETRSRSLQHPELDALVDATLMPSVVDVSFDQGITGAVSMTAKRLSTSTVVVQIDDSLHVERDGYVVIAAYDDGTYQLVGYVNSLSTSSHRIYHDVPKIPTTVTYGAAVINRTLVIERFIVGPTVSLS